MGKIKYIYFCVLFLDSFLVYSSGKLDSVLSKPRISYNVEYSGVFANGSNAPLWLNANKQGISSITKNSGYVIVGISVPMFVNRAFACDYGLELVKSYNSNSDIHVQQAYIDLRYKAIQLSLGSKNKFSALDNGDLSSGGLAYSGNSKPIPQICVELPQFLFLPYTKKWLSFKASVAYGCFTDGRWQKKNTKGNGNRTSRVLYHSKSFMLKIEDPKNTSLRFECGMEMFDQFGGIRYFAGGKVYKMQNKIVDYFKALIPMHGGKISPDGDQANIEGNMLGDYLFSLKYSVNSWEIHPYYEHYFEDQSMMWGKYPWKDGLIGLQVTFPKNKIVSVVNIEYIGSMYQSGPFGVIDKSGQKAIRIAGGDDYYNNWLYLSWSHYGMAIGNPLFRSPIYNKSGNLIFESNRMTARHLGISGLPTKNLKYRVLMSYTRNWGRYNDLSFPEHGSYKVVRTNISTLFELTFSPHKLSGWSFVASAATDRGDMLGNNIGVMLTVRLKR